VRALIHVGQWCIDEDYGAWRVTRVWRKDGHALLQGPPEAMSRYVSFAELGQEYTLVEERT